MIPTPEVISRMERARWTADPEAQGALDYLVTTLTEFESDGISMLERVYRTCPHENQRNHQIWAAMNAYLCKRFKAEIAVFSADCPDDGRCRFHLSIGRGHADVKQATAAHRTYFLNLLKPLEEWIRPAPESETPPR